MRFFMQYIWHDWVLTWSEFRARTPTSSRSTTRGVALAALLVSLTVMQIFMALALPQWQAWVQREKELELIWRGQQYVQALMYYYAKYRSYPPNIDILVQQHFLRKKYKEPFHPDGKWDILRQGQPVSTGRPIPLNQPDQKQKKTSHARGKTRGGIPTAGEVQTLGPIVGVRSFDTGEAIIKYKGGTTHDSWMFVFNPQQLQKRRIQPGQLNHRSNQRKQFLRQNEKKP